MKRFFATVRDLTAAPDCSDTSVLCNRTKRQSVWEGVFWSVMWGFGETYIVPFALLLNAGSLALAFAGTGPVLISAVAQLAGAAALDRLGRRMPAIRDGVLIQALCYPLLFIVPVLLPQGGATALLLILTVSFFAFGFSVPPWLSLMGDIVEPSERGRYFSGRTRVVMLGMIVSMLIAGWSMNLWKRAGHPATGFGFLFGIACLARLICLQFLRRHYDAPYHKTPDDARFSFLDFIRATPRSNFARFTFTVALMNGTAQIAGPFFAVYMLRDLHWSYFAFTVNIAVFLLAQTLFVRWWGMIGDRHGNRSVLVATCCLMPLLPLLWIVSSNYALLLFAQVVSGACWSGFNLAASNFVYDAVSKPKRARAFSYYNLLNGIFSVAGGVLIGAPLAEYLPSELRLGPVHVCFLSSLPLVFLISGAARALVAWMMLPRFREVREAEPIHVTRILWRLGTGQPLFAQAVEFIPLIRRMPGNGRRPGKQADVPPSGPVPPDKK